MTYRTEDEWKAVYRARKGYWEHSGNPADPHIKLTSGRHSNFFFNSHAVIADEELLDQAAWDLGAKLRDAGLAFTLIQRVVGPQTGATKLSQLLATVATNYAGAPVNWASPAKHEEHGEKSMVWVDGEPTVYKNDEVLLCEDVLTTLGSVKLAEAAVRRRRAQTAPYVAALVNRSGKSTANGKRIVALITPDAQDWAPEECELCKAGSKAIDKPKDNWDQLVHAA